VMVEDADNQSIFELLNLDIPPSSERRCDSLRLNLDCESGECS